MNKLKIFDLDGTIIDSSHRYKTMECGNRIDLDHWRENCTPELIAKDSLLPHIAEYNKAQICPDTTVIIATARSMIKDDANFDYIKNVMGEPDHIIHREGDNDNRKGDVLKTSGIMKAIEDIESFDIIHIYEDNFEQLQKMAEFFDQHIDQVIPVFVQSEQGH